MDRQVNGDTHLTLTTVEMSELTQIDGGIWRYSSRLGALGEQLEARQDAKYNVSFNPGTIDGAAGQALENWVSIP